MITRTVLPKKDPIMKSVLKELLAGLGTLVALGPIAVDAQAFESLGFDEEDASYVLDRCVRYPSACWRIPKICSRDDLSDRLQGLCDRIRFRDEPHYLVAKIAPNGGIRSYHLIRTDTGQEVLTAYPYGLARAIPTDDPRERQESMKYDRLAEFWRGRPTPDIARRQSDWASFFQGSKAGNAVVKATTDGSSTFFPATGLLLGWSPSVGPSTGDCIEYTMGVPVGVAVATSFNSSGQASSTAEQINISATVKGAYGAFQAKDNFSYSDKYQASANSGFQYWNFANIYTLNTAATGTFTDQGQAAINNGSFSTTCGTQYLTSVQGGFFATISMSWNSSSASTSSDISNTFSGNYDGGLASLETAATVATSSSSAQAAFNITMTIYGGSKSASATELTPTQVLSNAFATVNSNNQPYYALCAGTLSNPPAPDASACNQFSGAMSTGAESASSAFTSWVNSIKSGSDVSGFELFPNGVAGVNNPGASLADMPQLTLSDVFAGYQTQLKQYMNVLNQLATLNNRAEHLSNAVSQDTYNPASAPLQLNLSGVLNVLQNDYDSARQTLVNNLTTCLSEASSSNIETVCAPILDAYNNSIKTAYDWIKANNVQPQQLLLQNTIALQYSGIYTNHNNSQWPQDVVYYAPLPSWSNVNSFILIGNQAGLIGFADAAYVNAGTTLQSASLAILPLDPTADLSEAVSEVYKVQSTSSSPGFWLWFGWVNGQQAAATNDKSQPLAWLNGSNFCTPTATTPCELWYGIDNPTYSAYPQSFRMNAITGLFPVTGETAAEP